MPKNVRITNRFSELLAAHSRKTGRKWTYEDVSKETGVSPSTMSAYAQNKVRRYDAVTLEALVSFFGCRIDEFLAVEKEAEEGQPEAVAAAV